ncbi:MAG: pseudouridylate synthase, partial [Thermoanaerobaculia bacterium]
LSLVEVSPREGRTHQIRSLFADIGRPLAGDLRFGKPKPARQFLEKFAVPGLLLHALELELPAGVVGPARAIRAPIPETFHRLAAAKGWECWGRESGQAP